MVVMELQYSGRASLSTMEEEEVLEREKEATKGIAQKPSFPNIYRRAKGGAPALGDPISQGGGGQGGWSTPPPPQGKWGAPPP